MKYETPALDRHTRPLGTFVVIRSRDDIDPSSDSVVVQHSGRSVTSVPENVGLCEVVDVGPDVTNVQKGDVCFIDFFDVAQGYLVGGEELYVSQAMALRMRLDFELAPVINRFTKQPERHQKTGAPVMAFSRCDVHPLPGYALTKHAPDRMTVAITGCDRMILPRDQTTRGIVGGRNSDGDPCTFICYEELVEFTPGKVQAERYAETWSGGEHDTYYEERRLKARIERLEAEVRGLGGGAWLAESHEAWLLSGVAPGDLVTFCSAFSIQFRAMGELFRCVPYKNLLAVIDDKAILEDFNRKNPPPPLVQLIGGGAAKLYGTG